MRDDKHIAIKLRKRGESYNKISQELSISKGTLSNWFSGLGWSETIKKELTRKANYTARKRLRLINKDRREMWERWRQGFRNEAKKKNFQNYLETLSLYQALTYIGEKEIIICRMA